MAKAALPRSSSSWDVGAKVLVTKKPRKQAVRGQSGCGFCGQQGHNRQTCKSSAHTLGRLAERFALMRDTGNPMEWERVSIMVEALQFVRKAKVDRRNSVYKVKAVLAEASLIAEVALAAWNWGKK